MHRKLAKQSYAYVVPDPSIPPELMSSPKRSVLISAPLTVAASGRATLVGLATAATECGPAFVYDRVAPHLRWIFENSDSEEYQYEEGEKAPSAVRCLFCSRKQLVPSCVRLS